MVIAEQNLSLLEGKVSRLIGLHAGQAEGRRRWHPTCHGADAAPCCTTTEAQAR